MTLHKCSDILHLCSKEVTYMMIFNSKLILEYIMNNNLSKKEFCELCDISKATLSNMLKFKDASNCHLQPIIRVANVLKCSLNDIVYH